MHAVTMVDGKLAWEQHRDPVPAAGELLVAVRASGLNGGEVALLRGHYDAELARLGRLGPARPAGPAIMGMEMAGEVVATGPGVQRFSVGDRVMAVILRGGQAELAVVHERLAMPVPERLEWAEAGGVPEVFTTVDNALFSHCRLQVGERVLVGGAAGGVGIAAVQVAARAGARVVASVRTEALRERVAEIGAATGMVEVVAPDEAATRGPFDVILEMVGAPNIRADIEALEVGGRLVVIGIEGGTQAQLDLMAFNARRAAIYGANLVFQPLEVHATAARRVEARVLPLLATGEVRMPVEATYPMEKAATAYERFAAGGKLGKIVLVN